MTSGSDPTFFFDENVLGLGKLLVRMGRTDGVFPGHQALASVPLGAPDLDWMPIVAGLGLVVVTRDRRIRTRPAELRVYVEFGIKCVWLSSATDLGPRQQVDLFLAQEARLRPPELRGR